MSTKEFYFWISSRIRVPQAIWDSIIERVVIKGVKAAIQYKSGMTPETTLC
ncbi:hypothetical protein [Clostridium sp.]|uniref:hypothetical protein n=1 Tax=Clostridium sp. TaxID=1506 RepID=UPI00321788D7